MNKDKNGFVIFDDDFRRAYLNDREISTGNEFAKKIRLLIQKRENGKITEEEFHQLSAQINSEHLEACANNYDAENFPAQILANA